MNKIVLIISFCFIGIMLGIGLYEYPIIIKWMAGSARVIGKEVDVDSYVNGKLSSDIKAFHINKYWGNEPADYYILNSPKFPNRLEFLSVNKADKYIGLPSATSKADYDIIFGYLFQSEVGSKFSLIGNSMKGLNFNPDFEINGNELFFNLPSIDNNSDTIKLRLVVK